MSTTGPVLPPHLQPKRKRSRDEDASPPPRDATSSDPTTKKARTIIGPASPPAPLDQRPSHPAESTADDASTSSEDDYGPALPSAHDPAEPSLPAEDDDLDPAEDDTPAQPTKRDEWMMLPPDKDDLSARMDPTKIRARKFNSGVGAKGGGGHTGVSSSGAWTETPQQKQKRLQDEVLGLSQAERPAPPSGVGKGSRKGDDVARKVQEHNVCALRARGFWFS